jgi:hypothetical protein
VAAEPAWPHDVRGLAAGELERAGRELRASLALSRPGSPARVPILARLAAIDAELAARRATRPGAQVIVLCSCGFGTDDQEWFQGHLAGHPGHHERPFPGAWLP